MRTLPHNDEAEKAILGALLLREDAYDIVSEVIESSDFYQPMNGVIYTAITKMKESSNSAIDFITLIDFLKKEGSIDKAGGIAFLAHPFEYRFDNTIDFIDELTKEKELDGIECFHPSANESQMKLLVEYANKNNLFISGGSDYHGAKKPDVEIGIGKGNLNISKNIIENWINL